MYIYLLDWELTSLEHIKLDHIANAKSREIEKPGKEDVSKRG